MLRGLLDQTRDGLLALDENGVIVEANAAAASILGHERNRLPGKPLAAVVALSDRRAFRRTLAHVGPSDERLELRVTGFADPWAIVLRALPNVAPRTIVAALMPLTEAQLRSERSERSERSDRIEHFALRFPHAVVAIRRNGTVAFANGRARSLLGREAVRSGTQFGESTPATLRSLARRLVEIPAPLHPTLVELPGDRTVRASGLAYTGDEPAILFLEDVTEQQRNERVTREFLRNAAHQLRTPLAGITAALETLQSGAKERVEDRDRFLGHLETHAARLTRIARGLLLLARAGVGEQLRVDLVELRPILEQTAQALAPRDGVRIETECEPGLVAVASPELLHETLAALAENAAAHTYSGWIRLTAVGRNGNVELSVIDSGGGILPEFRERIFEPFYRVAEDGRGYGLGLAIAAQAVQAMNGTIEVADAPGGGTMFTVTLRSGMVVR